MLSSAQSNLDPLKYCLINEQECFIRFKVTSARICLREGRDKQKNRN